MKIKNKGKVHPSPSSPSPSSDSSPKSDAQSVLKLLPAAILTLVVALPLEDREVVAYMITRSINAANPPSIINEYSKKKKSKKFALIDAQGTTSSKHEPLFDCDCFDCYTSFWFRWDCSPNREVIHKAIEAFEDHLSNGESSSKRNPKGKKKERQTRRAETGLADCKSMEPSPATVEPLPQPLIGKEDGPSEEEEVDLVEQTSEGAPEVQPPANHDKSLTVKAVAPSVLSLLSSRFWSLWSPKA